MKGLDRILSDQQADADGSEDEKKIKEKGDKLKQKLKKRHAQQLQDMCLEKEESKPEEIGDLQSVQSEFEGKDKIFVSFSHPYPCFFSRHRFHWIWLSDR